MYDSMQMMDGSFQSVSDIRCSVEWLEVEWIVKMELRLVLI